MKSLSRLSNDFRIASHRLGKSHLTQEARLRTANIFVRHLEAHGVQIEHIDQVGGRHLVQFAKHQLLHFKPRTVANRMSHLREFLRVVGKRSLADDPTFSNAALGIPQGSRKGTKTPMTAAQLDQLDQQAQKRKRPGHAAGIQLQFHVGLRAEEAVQASTAVLAGWLRELTAGDSVTVSEGTKGGRVRQVHLPDAQAAIAVIRTALAITESHGGFLIQQIQPGRLTLKQAMDCYCGYFQRRGVQTHSARYAFACHRIEAYEQSGMSRSAALSRTARDLGHGPGRGRWVKSVYARYLLDRNDGLESSSE